MSESLNIKYHVAFSNSHCQLVNYRNKILFPIKLSATDVSRFKHPT